MTTIPELEQLVNQLQAQVDELQASQVDTLSPNYLVVNADGTVTANFSGFVDALGLQLPTALTTPDVEHHVDVIRWVDPNTNKPTGGAYSQYSAGNPNTRFFSQAEASTDTSIAYLETFDDQAAARAFLYASQSNRGAAASIGAVIGSHSTTILNQDGGSSFLQIAGGPAVQTIVAGGGTVPGTGSSFIQFNVNHGLGRVPLLGFAYADGIVTAMTVLGYSSTVIGFQLNGLQSSGTPGNPVTEANMTGPYNVHFIVIG